MKHDLTYDINFIDVLSSLQNINPQILVNKNDDKLYVTSNTADTKVYYTVTADAEKFNFTGSKFAILNYIKFKQYFTACQVSDKTKLPILETINDDEADEPATVVIKQPVINAEIKHSLAEVDGIIRPALYNADEDSYYEIGVNEASAEMVLTAEQLNYLQKMVGNVGATSIKFSVNNGICNITLFNPKTSDMFSQSYAVKTKDDVAFDAIISEKALALLPSSNYNVTIDKDGMIQFSEDRTDGINVNLYLMTEVQ